MAKVIAITDAFESLAGVESRLGVSRIERPECHFIRVDYPAT